jgi:hypothetical protein
MSSTSNRNSQAEYKLQTAGNQYMDDFWHYENSVQPVKTMFPGNDLLPCRIGRDNLSHNSVDVETYLFGIGSTNLVNPKSPFVPEIRQLQSINITRKSPLIMPQPNNFLNSDNERPLIYKQ